MVRERDLARPRRRAAADQRRRRCGVMRRAEEPLAQRAASNAPATLRTAADSSASSCVIAGSRPARRCASIDLPVPGGPTISTLGRRPRRSRARAWRSLALDLGAGRAERGRRAAGRGRHGSCPSAARPGRARARRQQVVGAATSRPPTAPLAALVCGARAARRAAAARSASVIGSAPRTGRSSPDERQLTRELEVSRRRGIWPRRRGCRARSAGRSARLFGRSAGARLTVMRLLCGKSRPLVEAPHARVARFLDLGSARPTSVKSAGRWRGAPRP